MAVSKRVVCGGGALQASVGRGADAQAAAAAWSATLATDAGVTAAAHAADVSRLSLEVERLQRRLREDVRDPLTQ